MPLESLEVRNFRCIENAKLQLDDACTIISGANASGKTSLLEAIHTLSCGHSFRAGKREVLIRQSTTRFEIVGKSVKAAKEAIIGLAGDRDGYEARINGNPIKGFAQIANLLPVRVIDPEVHHLIEGGPSERRQFIDWGAFHVEPTFAIGWRRFQKALKQRNAALKAKLAPQIVTSWDSELIAAAETITTCRERYLQELAKYVREASATLSIDEMRLDYYRGWSHSETLTTALGKTLQADMRYGGTTIGPQRADLEIKIGSTLARDRVSRGQQKMIASALLLAQINHWQIKQASPACLLVDDPAAELDVDNFQKLLHSLEQIASQLIITALDPEPLMARLNGKRFHVEQGHLHSVL